MSASLDYSRFLSKAAASRQPSAIRETVQLLARSPPSTIGFTSGSPNVSLFPFQDATINLKDGTTLHVDSSAMSTALQYSPTPGLPDLVEWFKKLHNHYHSPIDFKRYELSITVGGGEGLSKVLELVLNPGDSILVTAPCYSACLDCLRVLDANVIEIELDANGMNAEHLNEILTNWSDSNSLPKAIYTVPNGSNPAGISMSFERKKDIYNIAQKYNILIIEDDPYYFLQFQKFIPSFLSMDVDGRVIRLDSMSKVLSSGMRVGYITAPIPLWQKIVYHQQITTMHTSSLSQMIILKLLEKWNLSGFHEHVEQVAKFYENQKTLMMNAINKHLKDMVTFTEPTSGMFIWLKINNIKDTKKLIYEKVYAEGALFLPGNPFFYDQSQSCPFVRISYSLCTPEQIEIGIARLGKVLQQELNQ